MISKLFFTNLPLPVIKLQRSLKQLNLSYKDYPFRFKDIRPTDNDKLVAKLYRPYFITIDTIKKFSGQADLDANLSIFDILKTFLEGDQISEKLYFKVDKK